MVLLEWGSILIQWKKLSGTKNLVLKGRNMSKKGVGSKCALCLHRVVTRFRHRLSKEFRFVMEEEEEKEEEKEGARLRYVNLQSGQLTKDP